MRNEHDLTPQFDAPSGGVIKLHADQEAAKDSAVAWDHPAPRLSAGAALPLVDYRFIPGFL